jgi:FkbM family methyltransferase
LAENAKLSGVGNMIVRNVGIGNTSGLEGGRIAVRDLDIKAEVNAGLEHGDSQLENNYGSLSLLGCSAENVDVSPSFEADALVAECQATGKDTRGSHVWVDVVSLDSFGWHVGASPKCPRVIKIDVEGMETQVLAGGRGLLSRCRPVLHVENNLEAASPHIIDSLLALGYDLYWELSTFSGQDNYFGVWRMSATEASSARLRVHLSVNLLGIPSELNFPNSTLFRELPANVRQAIDLLTPVHSEFSRRLRDYPVVTAFEYADMTLGVLPVRTADGSNEEGVMIYVKKPFKLLKTALSQIEFGKNGEPTK